MTAADFRAMCRDHDLTHAYSDDHRCWENGRKELLAITLAAAELPRQVAMQIWNEEVDRKVLPYAQHEYHWSE